MRGDTAGEWGAVSEARGRGEQTSPHANAKVVVGCGGWGQRDQLRHPKSREEKKGADLG